MVKKDQKRVQAEQLYVQLQMLDGQIQQAQQELQNVAERKQELHALKESVGILGKTKKGSKSMAQIGMGIYAESKLENTKELLVNVGAGIYTKKKIADVQKMVEEQFKELENAEADLTKNAQMLMMQAQVIQGELQSSMNLEK